MMPPNTTNPLVLSLLASLPQTPVLRMVSSYRVITVLHSRLCGFGQFSARMPWNQSDSSIADGKSTNFTFPSQAILPTSTLLHFPTRNKMLCLSSTVMFTSSTLKPRSWCKTPNWHWPTHLKARQVPSSQSLPTTPAYQWNETGESQSPRQYWMLSSDQHHWHHEVCEFLPTCLGICQRSPPEIVNLPNILECFAGL